MAIHVMCPNCGKEFHAADTDAGRKGQCGNCGQVIEIPSSEPVQDVQPAGQQGGSSLPARMVANKAIAGQVCPSCQAEIFLGQRIRNCEACGVTLHETCWDSNGGCSTPGCSNAPLPDIQQGAGAAATVSAEQAAIGMTGKKPCKFCGEPIQASAKKCRHCGEFQSAGAGRYTGPPRTCGAAKSALIWGIVSFFCFGIITGPIAISYGRKAKREIEASRGRLTGTGMASAGVILGTIALILFVVGIVVRIVVATSMH